MIVTEKPKSMITGVGDFVMNQSKLHGDLKRFQRGTKKFQCCVS